MQEGMEIVGRYILAFVKSTGDVSAVFERKTREIFEQNGLNVDEIEEDSWHDANRYADAMHEIREEVGEKTLRQAGAEQAGDVPWPENVNSVADGLEFLVQADKDAHRTPDGEYGGDYNFELTGESTARVGIPEYAPYPVDNFKGVFEGAVNSLSDSGNARLSDVEPHADERAAFEVTW